MCTTAYEFNDVGARVIRPLHDATRHNINAAREGGALDFYYFLRQRT